MATYYLPGCDTTIPQPQCSDCPTKELGDVRAFFLVRNDFAFTDITSESEWITGLNAKQIYVFPYTKGSIEPAENLADGFGNQDQTLDSYTYTANLMIGNDYAQNRPFWNAIKNSRNWLFGYKTETLVHLADKEALIVPKAPVNEGKKEKVLWNIMATWTQEDLMDPQAEPTGIFDECIEVS